MSRSWKVRCKAWSRRHNQPCRAWAVKGLGVCISHGGGSKKARAAGARRWAELQKASQLARRRFGLTIPTATDAEVVHEAEIRQERQEREQLRRIRVRTDATEVALMKLMARIDHQAQLEAEGIEEPSPWHFEPPEVSQKSRWCDTV